MAVIQQLHVCLFVILLICVQSMGKPSFCEQKETLLTSLDVAKNAISKAMHLYPNCTGEEISVNKSDCSKKSKSIAYLNIAMNLISGIAENYPPCLNQTEKEEKPTDPQKMLMDCSDVLQNGHNKSGVYTIWPKNGTVVRKSIDVYCDMDTDAGGWVVIQRRGNFPKLENFYRNWTDYKLGFGSIQRDFWLGNDNIFLLTNQGQYTVRFDLESYTKKKGFAVYKTFRIEDETFNYKLHIQNYSGNIGDSMQLHDGMKFSTYDKQNDLSPKTEPCARERKGGWWYNNCYRANLNALYDIREGHTAVTWNTWIGFEFKGLAAVEIKIRRT